MYRQREIDGSSSGIWAALEKREDWVRMQLRKELWRFHEPTISCCDAGMQAAHLPEARHEEQDMLAAAPFLKRTLTDLRCVWSLIHNGYPSQAASVTAGLMEHALVVSSVAGSSANVQELLNAEESRIPWSVWKLCEMHAKRESSEAGAVSHSIAEGDIQTDLYSWYGYLCDTKHATLDSTQYDQLSAIYKRMTVIMPTPDIRPEDLPRKATILCIAIKLSYVAIRQFARALNCDQDSEYFQAFLKRMAKVRSGVDAAFQSVAQMPLPLSFTQYSDW